jgi:hypothetical protein
MDKPVEVAAIETALATLLETIDQRRTKLATIDKQEDVTNSLLDDLVNDPIGESCGLGIRLIGEQLHKLDEGHTQLMTDVRDRVCKNNDEWAEIIDKRWRGIGGSAAA